MASAKAQKFNNRSPQKSTLLKVVLLGDGGVGKSCLMNRFVSGEFNADSYHTIGVEFLNKDIIVNSETYTLQIWDTAGQERFRSLRTPFYRGSDICILTYSVDDKTSFENLTMWKNEFLSYADIKDCATFPFIVVGNKVDIVQEKREVTPEELQQWCGSNDNPPSVETSAKDAINVEEAFHMAVENWQKMEERMERPLLGNTVNLNRHAKRESCCV